MSRSDRTNDSPRPQVVGRLVTVARFASTAEAGLNRSRLEAEGIEAVVQGGVSRDILGYYGTAVSDAQLQVAEQDAGQAREILGIGEDGQPSSPLGCRGAEVQPWTCPGCGNRVEDGFEVCWSCGTAIDETSPPPATPKPVTSLGLMGGADIPATGIECPKCERPSHDETAPHVAEAAADQIDTVEATLNRAWRSAILGIVLLPPILNIYSLILLGR